MTLPNNFGTYTVDGVLTPTEFGVTYTGSDRGSMNLVRP